MRIILEKLKEISVEELSRCTIILIYFRHSLDSEKLSNADLDMLLAYLPANIQEIILKIGNQEKYVLQMLHEKFTASGKNIKDIGIDEVNTELYRLLTEQCDSAHDDSLSKLRLLLQIFNECFDTSVVINKNVICPLQKLTDVISAKRMEISGVTEKNKWIDWVTERNITQLRRENSYNEKEKRFQKITFELEQLQKLNLFSLNSDQQRRNIFKHLQLKDEYDKLNAEVFAIKAQVKKIYKKATEIKDKNACGALNTVLEEQKKLQEEIDHSLDYFLNQYYGRCLRYKSYLEQTFIKQLEKTNPEVAKAAQLSTAIYLPGEVIAGPSHLECYLRDIHDENSIKINIEDKLRKTDEKLMAKQKYQAISSLVDILRVANHPWEPEKPKMTRVERLNCFFEKFNKVQNLLATPRDSRGMRLVKFILSVITFNQSNKWFKPEGKKLMENLERISLFGKKTFYLQRDVGTSCEVTATPAIKR